MSQARIQELEVSLEKVTARVTSLETKVSKMTEVVAAATDDVLRVCTALEELSQAGRISPLPWNLATLMVEIHHARYAKEQGEVTDGDIDSRILELTVKANQLREFLRHGPTP